MMEIDKADIETAGASFGMKVAENFYRQYGVAVFVLNALLRRIDTECVIQADADWIREEVGFILPKHEKMITRICNALNTKIIKDFPIIEDDFNFEDDFADEYGDSPANVYNIAFWNAFDDTLKQYQSE